MATLGRSRLSLVSLRLKELAQESIWLRVMASARTIPKLLGQEMQYAQAIGIPRGRCFPLGFGMYTLFTGVGTYLFSLRSARRFVARSSEYPSMVSPSIP